MVFDCCARHTRDVTEAPSEVSRGLHFVFPLVAPLLNSLSSLGPRPLEGPSEADRAALVSVPTLSKDYLFDLFCLARQYVHVGLVIVLLAPFVWRGLDLLVW